MRFHALHIHPLLLRNGEFVILAGFAMGRVHYEPRARWLYSFRTFLLVFKVEILFETGLLQ